MGVLIVEYALLVGGFFTVLSGIGTLLDRRDS